MSKTDTMSEADRKARITELRAALADREQKMTAAIDAVKIEDNGGIVVDAEMRDTFRKAHEEAREIKAMIGDLEGLDEVKRFLDQPEGESVAVLDAIRQMQAGLGRGQRKTLGEMVVSSAEFTEMKANNLDRMTRPFAIDGTNLGELGYSQKDIYTATGGDFTGSAFGSRQDSGIVERARRSMRVRDLFPNDTTTANLIEYIRVTGFTNNARVVPERENADGTANPAGPVFGRKPKSDLLFSPEQAPVRTIAHIVDAHKNVLDDEPRLRRIIDGEMLYGLRLAEDEEILTGDGTGVHILGLLNTPGIQQYAQATVATDKKSAAIRRAATRAILAYYEPTGVVFHPFDWEDIELEEDDSGAFRVALSVAIGAERRIWRLNAVETPAMPESTALVGSFGLGARLWDRQQANVMISTENRDNFERNAVTIRAEERVALEVPRPESFVEVTLVAA